MRGFFLTTAALLSLAAGALEAAPAPAEEDDGMEYFLPESADDGEYYEGGRLEKRFKTSPFAWSNPLSGYSVVLVRVPGTQAQLQVVRNKEDPRSRLRSFLLPDAGKARSSYVIKWIPNDRMVIGDAGRGDGGVPSSVAGGGGIGHKRRYLV